MGFPRHHRINERTTQLAMQVPLSLAAVIDDIAYSESVSVSTVMLRAIRKGLEVERSERETALKAKQP